MTDTSEPKIDWSTAPQQMREAFERTRQQLDQATQSLAELPATQRTIAMLRAGVDESHPAAAVFMRGYDGELEVDAVKAAWTAIAGTSPTATPPPTVNPDGSDPAVEDQLRDLANQQNQLGNNGVPAGDEPTVDPQTEMIQGFHEDRKRGLNRPQAMARGLDKLFTRAAEGDERIVSTGGRGVSAAEQSVQKWRQKNWFDE